MKVAAAAFPITFHSSLEDWKLHITEWCERGAASGAQILMFPEYGAMEMVSLLPVAVREDLREQVLQLHHFLPDFQAHFSALAQTLGVVIIAPSIPQPLNGIIINRAWVFGPQGAMGYQDKHFMTPFERFDWGVASGEKVLTVFDTDFGSFGIQICYDSEFAIGSRLLALAGAQAILIPSCTETIRGATRVHIGARARSLENQVYSMVSQTIGEALWSPAVDYNYGYCAAYCPPDFGFPDEGILSVNPPNQADWLIQEFDFAPIPSVRESGAVRNFVDHQQIDMQLVGQHNFEVRHFRL